MKKLQKAFETSVNICFVSDEKYAKPLCTSLYSLLYNRDKTRNYDILILQDDIPGEAQEQIYALGKDEPGVSIRFINMRERKSFFRKRQMRITQQLSITACICLMRCSQIMKKCCILIAT